MIARWFVAACLSAMACDAGDRQPDYTGVLAFDTARVRIITPRDTISILVEVARSADQKAMGLMERRSLPDTVGMLFLYASDQAATAGFWMYRTRIPLDIAFADSSGVIVATRRMEPCEARLAAGCPTYEPGAPYRAALEVNAGFLDRHGIGPGSRLVVDSPAPPKGGDGAGG